MPIGDTRAANPSLRDRHLVGCDFALGNNSLVSRGDAERLAQLRGIVRYDVGADIPQQVKEPAFERFLGGIEDNFQPAAAAPGVPQSQVVAQQLTAAGWNNDPSIHKVVLSPKTSAFFPRLSTNI